LSCPAVKLQRMVLDCYIADGRANLWSVLRVRAFRISVLPQPRQNRGCASVNASGSIQVSKVLPCPTRAQIGQSDLIPRVFAVIVGVALSPISKIIP
jgi:hypothetical protein